MANTDGYLFLVLYLHLSYTSYICRLEKDFAGFEYDQVALARSCTSPSSETAM